MTRKFRRDELVMWVEDLLEFDADNQRPKELDFPRMADRIIGMLGDEGVFDPNQVEGA